MKLAWLTVPLVLLALLTATGSAFALSEAEATSDPTAQLDEEVESEDECVEVDEEETDSEEAGEECEAEADDTSFSPAEDCYLRTARARIVAYPTRNTMRLTLGYTTYTPAQATVEYSAKHNRLGTVTRKLGRSGVIRLSKHLGEGEMDQMQGSHRFTVTVHVPEAPPACQRFETEQLQVEHSSDSRITWSEDR
ncbi:MAG: hypothetical protein QOF13_1688 [Solirubrobacterales bacterium]|jgi:hypothetical protein|nr:hypothetical protein [Solirubrobacterales bacterium]